METELWPNLFRVCRRQSIPVALINGRISTTSFRRYAKIRTFMARVLNDLSIAVMQSEQDLARIRELGIASERSVSVGNLKFDSADSPRGGSAMSSMIRDRFGINQNDALIVAASTHAPEEQVVIDAFKLIKESEKARRVRLLIAPRHPERFRAVAELIQASGLAWTRRSANPAPADATADVVLLDSIGELRSVFSLADVAFIGGSIASRGGHNVLEAAAEGLCVITGAHTDNFTSVMNAFLSANALIQLSDIPVSEAAGELAAAISELLKNDSRRHEIGRRALAVCENNRGATKRTLEIISSLLTSPSSVREPVPFPAIHLTTAK